MPYALQVASAIRNTVFSNIAELSCGTSVAAVGSTIYELELVGDLESREDAVLTMTLVDCVFDETPADTDCYK